jgi:phage-related minor tail protein
MGEAGPEAVMPLQRGPSGKLGVRAEGGGSSVVVNYSPTINANDARGVSRVLADDRRRLKAELMRAMRDGDMRRTIGFIAKNG